MNSNILELFGLPTSNQQVDWKSITQEQRCPYLDKTCIKIRKSQPEISIGSCSVQYNLKNDTMDSRGVLICLHRFLERKQIFMDCIHLLALHEPGNELHCVAEVDIPGGSVDYFLVSVKRDRVVDFVGIELQALDTTGSVWPDRQRFLQESLANDSATQAKPYGINWKMTAKTTLVQLHHKIETFENLNKHLVLVLQDLLLDYMRREFSFGHVDAVKLGDSMHFHAYNLRQSNEQLRIGLGTRSSTNAAGIATCLGLLASPKLELTVMLSALEAKISAKTLLTI